MKKEKGKHEFYKEVQHPEEKRGEAASQTKLNRNASRNPAIVANPTEGPPSS